MSRWLPAPKLSVVLLVVWLVLNNTLHPAHWFLGGLFALAVPALLHRIWPQPVRIARPDVLITLFLRVMWDIVVSNIEIARRILGPESAIHPRFVWFPLTLTEPRAIATLAGIITMTPGTLSSDITPDRRYLLIHAFNVTDEAALIADMRKRYEAPLRLIFTTQTQRVDASESAT
jgi:multicomponent K+:H+ antiporter subunit E